MPAAAACVSWTVSTRGKDLVIVQMVVACTQLPEKNCSLGKDVCLMCQLHTVVDGERCLFDVSVAY